MSLTAKVEYRDNLAPVAAGNSEAGDVECDDDSMLLCTDPEDLCMCRPFFFFFF